MFIEYCGGGALDGIMVELEKPLTEPQIRHVCRDMCVALEFLHRRHVIHRDIKAGNVLLTTDGDVKLGKVQFSVKWRVGRFVLSPLDNACDAWCGWSSVGCFLPSALSVV